MRLYILAFLILSCPLLRAQTGNVATANVGTMSIVVVPPPASNVWLTVTGTTGQTTPNYTVGGKIVIGSQDVVVTHLGRKKINIDTGTRKISIWDAAYSLVASITMDLTGQTQGTTYFTALSNSVTLTHNQTYYLGSYELGGFYSDVSNTFTTNSVAALITSVYASGDTAPTTANTVLAIYAGLTFVYSSPP
jgi:hypothetical protein